LKKFFPSLLVTQKFPQHCRNLSQQNNNYFYLKPKGENQNEN